MKFKFLLKQYIKMFAQTAVLPLWYRICCRQPVQPGLVVFADAHHNERPVSMRFLYEKLMERPEKLCIHETYLDYQRSSPGAVIRHMFDFMKWYARADCVIICDNFLPAASCRKRKETRVIQLWHACGALKKFGYDTTDDIPKQYRGNVFRNIDLVTVSAPKCVDPFASAMRLAEGCAQPLGVCRTDVFFQEDWKERCRKEFYGLYPQAAGKKIVLWAPTFRGNPGSLGLPGLNLQQLQRQLGEEWLVLSRVHPHMHADYQDTDCKLPTDRLFPVIDVLIADYSSLIYEYLLFEKPLVLYVPDLDHYRSRRGFYYDYSEIPGRQVKEEGGLSQAIKQEYSLYHQQDAEKKRTLLCRKREGFLNDYMSSCDGHATQRVIEYICRTLENNEMI